MSEGSAQTQDRRLGARSSRSPLRLALWRSSLCRAYGWRSGIPHQWISFAGPGIYQATHDREAAGASTAGSRTILLHAMGIDRTCSAVVIALCLVPKVLGSNSVFSTKRVTCLLLKFFMLNEAKTFLLPWGMRIPAVGGCLLWLSPQKFTFSPQPIFNSLFLNEGSRIRGNRLSKLHYRFQR